MPVDRSFVERNRAETARLRDLVARLTEDDLHRSVGGGWTVSAALAHLAFWDRRAIVLLEKWEREGVGPSGADSGPINEAALPQWLAIPPRESAQMALNSAEEVDRKLESVDPEILEQSVAIGSPINVIRANHRAEHIEQIEQALKA